MVPKDMMLLRKVKGVAHFLPSNEDVRYLNEQDYALVQQFLSFGEIENDDVKVYIKQKLPNLPLLFLIKTTGLLLWMVP